MQTTSPSAGRQWRAIGLFFALAYAISWSAWAVLFSQHWSHLSGAGFYIYLFAILAPHLAAVCVSAFEGGAAGVAEFYGRVFRRVPWRWAVAAVAVPIVIYLGRYLLGAVLGETQGAPLLHPAPRTLFILLFGQTAIALGEEPGWRGFALNRLTDRAGVIFGSVLLGVGWAIWHLPLFLIAGTSQYGTPFLPFLITLVAWSLVVANLVRRARGAVIVAMLFHASANVCDFIMWEPGSGTVAWLPWVVAALIAVRWDVAADK